MGKKGFTVSGVYARFRGNALRLYAVMANRNRRAMRLSFPARAVWGLANSSSIAFLMVSVSLFFLDEVAYRWADALHPAQRAVFHSITHVMALSSWDLIIPVSFCFLVFFVANAYPPGRRKSLFLSNLCAYAASFLFILLLSALVVSVIKLLVGRSRPTFYEQMGVLDVQFFQFGYLVGSNFFDLFHLPFGFPSGHATIIGAKAAFFTFLLPAWRLPIAVVAFWMALSRVALEAHYLSDVVAGVWLGVAISTVCVRWMARRRLGFTLLDGQATRAASMRVWAARSIHGRRERKQLSS